MSDISNSLDEFKGQLDIVDVISRVVTLKRAGVNFKGICPFHNEKTPSFIVSEQKQIFTCFGCGASGDVIEFTKRYYNLEFQDAIEKLAKENGIVYSFSQSESTKEREKYFDLNKEAAKFFYNTFISGKNPGYTYMKKRGIDDAILKKFGIGYADDSWNSTMAFFEDKCTKKEMLDLGLISSNGKKDYDKFRERVIFPIFNTSGKVTGFTGRTISDGTPKYLNSPENIVFQKKNNLYGISIAKQEIAKNGYAILVEGNMDVISLYQAGVKNVVASCGTALTENQAKLLKKYTKNIVLCYDSDSAGINASLRGIDILSKEGLNVKVMNVSDGKDPDDFIKQHGKDEFISLVENAISAIEYKLNNEKKGLDLSKDDDKVEYINRAKAILSTLSPAVQDIYIKKISNEIKVSESAFKLELSKTNSNSQTINSDNDINKEISIYLNKYEGTLIKILFIDSSYIEKIIPYDSIFSSFLGKKIKNIMYELYNEKSDFSEEEVLDKLEFDESQKVKELLDSIIVSGNESNVFDDVIIKWKLNELTNREKQLIDMLSLANEDENPDAIIDINKELLKVQSEIKNIRRV